jgi:hypothetical protein
VEESEDICAILTYAEFASVNLPMKEKFLVLRNQAGSKL